MASKGLSIISGVIFLALTITATAIIYQAGVPVVQQLQAGAAVDNMKNSMADLDRIIREVAGEGRGSKRSLTISSDPGILTINSSTDAILWKLETNAPVVSPRTSQQFGNLIVGSNLEASLSEGNYTGTSPQVEAFILENTRLRVFIRKVGSPSSHASIRTDALVLGIYNKDLDSWLNNPGFLEISIDEKEASKSGTGYTQAVAAGSNLPSAAVKAYIATTYLNYYLTFTLESGADFLTIEGREA